MENQILEKILSMADPVKANILSRFFKTDKGQYGEGDVFLGIPVPSIRQIAKKNYNDANLNDVADLLKSEFHEVRLCALLILVYKFPKSSEVEKRKIFDFYLSNTKSINNWDLVDVTCKNIVGEYLTKHLEDLEILYTLSKSSNLWERRISIISTFSLINKGEFGHTIDISRILLSDKEDLINKAVGWAIREVYKKDRLVAIKFIEENLSKMPRVTLRYAIEKMPDEERLEYLK